MLSKSFHARLLAAVAALFLTLVAPAAAADPWVADPSDIEGVYIITGTGPPNTRVDLVRVGSTWVRPHYNDATINEGEYTSPSGQFRIDEGFCNPAADCDGGSDDPFQIVFYRGPSVVPMWGQGTFFRSESQKFNLPEVEDVARANRVFINTSGPASLPAYSTISGTTRIVPAGGGAPVPLAGVLVDAFSSNGRGSDDLYGSGGEYSARTYSTADGSWSMKAPPGSWALRYRTTFGEPFYPGYIWSGCVIEPSPIQPAPGTPPPAGTAFLNTPASGIELTVGAGGTCNGSIPSGGGTPPKGDGGGGGDSKPAKVSGAKTSTAANGTVTLTVTVSGPGAVSATSSVPAPKGGAKKSAAKPVTVAKASGRAKKAGPFKLVLKLTKAGKKLVNQRGKVTAKTKVVFKPASGASATTTKSVTFKKKPPAKKKKKR